MLLRVIKERWNEDGSPMIDPSSGAALRQFTNGGMVRILDPKTRQPRSILPGESFELPDGEAQDLLRNAPQSVETEARHQEREAARTRRSKASQVDRDALDARMRDLASQVEQSQKLRAMAEQRERERAAENLRVSEAAKNKDAELEALREEHQKQLAAAHERMAQLEARLQSALAPTPAKEPAAPATTAPAEKQAPPERPAQETADQEPTDVGAGNGSAQTGKAKSGKRGG